MTAAEKLHIMIDKVYDKGLLSEDDRDEMLFILPMFDGFDARELNGSVCGIYMDIIKRVAEAEGKEI